MKQVVFLFGSILALQSVEGARVRESALVLGGENASALVVSDDHPEPDEDTCSAVMHRRKNLQRVRIPIALMFAGSWVMGGHFIFQAAEHLFAAGAASAGTAPTPAWVSTLYNIWYKTALVVDGVEAVAVGLAGSNALISKFESGQATEEEIAELAKMTMGAEKFIAYGSHRPRCCCRAGSDGEDCEVMPADNSEMHCPEGTERHPGSCSIQEIISFSPTQTVHGCQCQNTTDCGTNDPHLGHAWCEVDASNGHCGTRFKMSMGRHAKRWDFCMMSGAPLKSFSGISDFTRNDFLASFIPNEHAGKGHSMLPTASQVISKYDTVAYRDSWHSETECFIGTPSETLSACAERCLEEGAQGYNSTGGHIASRHTSDPSQPDPCVAFAYSPTDKQCVTLPERAQDSKFTPLVSDWQNPQGWQHFTLRSSLRCERGAVHEMVSRYEIAPAADSETDRFVHLKCKDDESGQTFKASCDEHECGGAPWCFVPENCHHHSRRHECSPIAAPECPA